MRWFVILCAGLFYYALVCFIMSWFVFLCAGLSFYVMLCLVCAGKSYYALVCFIMLYTKNANTIYILKNKNENVDVSNVYFNQKYKYQTHHHLEGLKMCS
jgi:hypothetical protein